MSPKECLPSSDCYCFHEKEIDTINSMGIRLEECLAYRDVLDSEIEKMKKEDEAKPLWTDPTFLVGGIIVSFTSAFVIGALLGAKKK